MRRAAFAVFAMLAMPGSAQTMTYDDCVAMVDRSPATAEKKAASWQTNGGGGAAMHCHALALFALKRYGEAALVLDALGRNRDVPMIDRSALFDQAAAAWMAAGKPREAVQSYTAALAGRPNDAALLAARGRARGLIKDWAGANADLTGALAQDSSRADLLVLRASARWALGRKTEFAADIVRALEIYPDYPPALLERGKRKFEMGDFKGAARDWQKVAASGHGETAADAKRYLKEMQAKR